MSQPAVAIENVTVRRGTRVILNNLSLTLPAGVCTTLMGANGSGKTTLTRLLTGAGYPSSGCVKVLGETLGQTDIRALRQRVSLVNPTTDSRDSHTPGAAVDSSLSTLDAVCTGYFGTIGKYDRATPDQQEHAAHLLQQVGLGTHLNQRFGLLSTGEQRRALIARALVRLPELLILDEPTYGLDLAGREHVLATVQQVLSMPKPPTVVLITHHVEELPPTCEKVVLLQAGRVMAQGKPEEVITPERLTATFGCKVYVRRIHGRYWPEVLPEAWLDLTQKK